jgi:energy-coupling factor transporter ATP-binding protein EcfA2
MLKRIYADNFKCLVGFEWEPGPAHVNLMLGPNGSGKTTVFECLERVRAFATGDGKVDELFPPSTLTQWQDVPIQSFAIEWEREGEVFHYELAIVHTKNRVHQEVRHERLSVDGKPLLRFETGEVHLYGENTSGEMSTYPFDPRQSAMASQPPLWNNTKLTWFRVALRRTKVLQIVPPMMDETSFEESPRPLGYFQNFVSWYRWISQDQGMAFRLQKELTEVLPGFSHFKLEPYGPEAKLLKAFFQGQAGRAVELSFGSLSDGQRMLIALYALLHGLAAQPEETYGNDLPSELLCLDEPDNFIASREIQPWLTAVEDRLFETKARLLVISHHPESIDYALIPSSGEAYSAFWFSRGESGQTRVQPLVADEPGGLKPSELAARGWLGLRGQAPEEPSPAKKLPKRKLTQLKSE